MTFLRSAAAVVILVIGGASGTAHVHAADAKAAVDSEAALTPDEIAERDGRKACKVSICAAFRTRKPGPDIACKVVKSWRKTQLDKMVSKVKISWPYGPVRCTADLKLKRDELIKAMTEKTFETKIEKHIVTCTIDRGEEPPTEIKVGFAPTVSFEDGKAVSASMNWDDLEAPLVVKSVLWTATGTDNTVNVLKGTLVEDINGFIGKKCDEVRADWDGK